MTTDFPWSPGSATGIGSLPGTDIVEATKTVLGELPDLPYLPELPARGPGADMIGRSAGMLVEMPVELYAAQWRVAAHPGRDLRRTHDLWLRDLDALTDAAAEFDGLLKVQVAGPWTMAAAIDLPIGGRMLRDAGAVRDLTASLAEGVALHVADVQARLPHTRLILQIDEPSLPTVLAGRVPTESGYGTLGAIDEAVARAALATVVAAAGVPVVVHCCAPDAPLDLVRASGAAAVAIDLALIKDLDPLGEVIDAGLGLFAGAVPMRAQSSVRDAAATRADAAERSGVSESAPNRAEGDGRLAAAAADRIKRLWRALGFSTNQLAEQVVITPACGLAGASVARARAITTACREAAKRLADE